MARAYGSPLRQWHGVAGGAEFLTRHGSQVVMQRKQRSKGVSTYRPYAHSIPMAVAHRWREQLRQQGVVVDVADLLRWVHAINRVAKAREVEVIETSSVGSWSPSYVYVEDGQLRTQCWVRLAAYGRIGYIQWGKAAPSSTGFPMNGWYDTRRNIYPDGSLFLSVVGSDLESLELIVGRRVTFTIPYRVASREPTHSPAMWCSAGSEYVAVPWPTLSVDVAQDFCYRVAGWQAPSVDLEGSIVFPYAIISPDGEWLEQAVWCAE